MTLRTVTFDPAQYKVVPVNPTLEMHEYAALHESTTGVYLAMLAHVPDTLPGVVEHSGEPVAFVAGDLLYFATDMAAKYRQGLPLFTHAAPAQPVSPQINGQYAETTQDSCAESGGSDGSISQPVSAGLTDLAAFEKFWADTYGQVLELTGDEEADATCRIAKVVASDAWDAALLSAAQQASQPESADALQEFGRHKANCLGGLSNSKRECTCGFTAAIAASKESR